MAVTLDQYALITLAQIKTSAGIPSAYTGSDDALTLAINEASNMIEHLLGRNVLARDYNEWQYDASRYITLRQWPINNVYGVYFGNTPGFQIHIYGRNDAGLG